MQKKKRLPDKAHKTSSVQDLTRIALREHRRYIAAHPHMRTKAAITLIDGARIVYWNHAAETLFGYTAAETVGKDMDVIVPDQYVELNRYRMGTVRDLGMAKVTGRPVEIVAQAKDGSELMVECFPTMKKIQGTLFFTIIIRDITGQIGATAGIDEISKGLTALGSSLTQNSRRALKAACELLQADFALYLLEEGPFLRTVAGWKLPRNMPNMVTKQGTICYDVIKKKKASPLIVRNCAETPFARTDPLLCHKSFHTVIGCCVKKQGKPVGVLAVFYKSFKKIIPDDRGLLAVLARGLGGYMDIVEKLRLNHRRLAISENYMKRLSRGMQDASEQEKKSLSQTLHDELGAMAVAANSRLAILEKTIRDKNLKAAITHLPPLRETLNDSVDNLKKLAANLRPPELDITGLQSTLHQYCVHMEEQTGVPVFFKCLLSPRDLPDSVSITVFRLVQEAINNSVRHARPESISVLLSASPDGLSLDILDDGTGFNVSRTLKKNAAHMGIRGMRERVESLRGMFQISSRPDTGTHISVRIPYNGGKR